MSYLSRLSGPLLDRIDMVMDVPRLRPEETERRRIGEIDAGDAGSAAADGHADTAALRELVRTARAAQTRRYAEDAGGIRYNAELSGKALHKYCRLEPDASKRFMLAYKELGLSARAHDRMLKVARTIADLDGSDKIQCGHMNEAILYRAIDLRMKRLREMEAVGTFARKS